LKTLILSAMVAMPGLAETLQAPQATPSSQTADTLAATTAPDTLAPSSQTPPRADSLESSAPKTLSIAVAKPVADTAKASQRHSKPVKPKLRNALYFDLTRWAFASAGAEAPLIRLAYERGLGQSQTSLLTALSFGYLSDDNDDYSALGLGLGLRHYLYRPMQGPFLQFMVDAGQGEHSWEGNGETTEYPRRRFLVAGFEYGYKVQTPSSMFSMHGGPSFYGLADNKQMAFIAGVDVGFPFSQETFSFGHGVSDQAAAQKPGAKVAPLKQTLSIHPITSLIFSGLSLTYTRPLRPRLTLEAPFYFGYNDQTFDQPSMFAGAGIGARFYLDKPQSGGYVAPLFEVLSITEFSDSENVSENREGGQGLLTFTSLRYGYTVLWPYFVIDLGLGFGWLQAFGDKTDVDSPQGNAFIPSFSVAFGLPF
jgi:hypothetical protein